MSTQYNCHSKVKKISRGRAAIELSRHLSDWTKLWQYDTPSGTRPHKKVYSKYFEVRNDGKVFIVRHLFGLKGCTLTEEVDEKFQCFQCAVEYYNSIQSAEAIKRRTELT